MTNKFAVTTDGALTFEPPSYQCPKHGTVRDGRIILYGPKGEPEGEYCMACYKDWIRATLQPITSLAAREGQPE